MSIGLFSVLANIPDISNVELNVESKIELNPLRKHESSGDKPLKHIPDIKPERRIEPTVLSKIENQEAVSNLIPFQTSSGKFNITPAIDDILQEDGILSELIEKSCACNFRFFSVLF